MHMADYTECDRRHAVAVCKYSRLRAHTTGLPTQVSSHAPASPGPNTRPAVCSAVGVSNVNVAAGLAPLADAWARLSSCIASQTRLLSGNAQAVCILHATWLPSAAYFSPVLEEREISSAGMACGAWAKGRQVKRVAATDQSSKGGHF